MEDTDKNLIEHDDVVRCDDCEMELILKPYVPIFNEDEVRFVLVCPRCDLEPVEGAVKKSDPVKEDGD